MKIEFKKGGDSLKFYINGEFQGHTRYFSYLGTYLITELGRMDINKEDKVYKFNTLIR